MASVVERSDVGQSERLARARGLIPVLRERADAAQKARTVPSETVADYWENGLYGVLTPRLFGGQEIRYDDFLQIGATLGQGDGSQAWIYSVITVHELMIALFSKEVQEEIWAKPRTFIASSFAPGAEPVKEKGGYRVSGKWTFCSGIDHARWMILGGIFGMVGDPPHPDVRFMLVPIEDCTVIDDWFVLGLQGTGSKAMTLQDVFVPENRVLSAEAMGMGDTPGGKLHDNNLYSTPLYAVLPFCLSAAATGIARGGYDRFVEGIKGRAAVFDHQSIAGMRHIQMRVAEASALIDAAEMLYRRAATGVADKIADGEALTIEERLRNRRDQAYSVVMATRALELLCMSTGGKGLFDNDPTRRAYCDLQAIAAHVAVTWDLPSASYGSVALGGQPLDFLF